VTWGSSSGSSESGGFSELTCSEKVGAVTKEEGVHKLFDGDTSRARKKELCSGRNQRRQSQAPELSIGRGPLGKGVSLIGELLKVSFREGKITASGREGTWLH